jgi:amylosucrase
MPLFAAPAGNSDGGYAVSSYREANPVLGTIADLAELATELRSVGISLVLDFVFNHTGDEHPWAIEARAHPDDEVRNCYLLFADRTRTGAYDATLREFFPEVRRGSFTWAADAGA